MQEESQLPNNDLAKKEPHRKYCQKTIPCGDFNKIRSYYFFLFFTIPAISTEPAFINPDCIQHIINTVKTQ